MYPFKFPVLLDDKWVIPSECSCGSTGGCKNCMPGNYFNGTGPIKQRREIRKFSIRDAWTCPVCHKGNAPHADKCGHCSDKIPAKSDWFAGTPEHLRAKTIGT